MPLRLLFRKNTASHAHFLNLAKLHVLVEFAVQVITAEEEACEFS